MYFYIWGNKKEIHFKGVKSLISNFDFTRTTSKFLLCCSWIPLHNVTQATLAALKRTSLMKWIKIPFCDISHGKRSECLITGVRQRPISEPAEDFVNVRYQGLVVWKVTVGTFLYPFCSGEFSLRMNSSSVIIYTMLMNIEGKHSIGAGKVCSP